MRRRDIAVLCAVVIFMVFGLSICHAGYHRSYHVKHQFEIETGHPRGWPGHVVDHVNPLACGGPDSPSNMQWQTIQEGKAKDKWERRGCSHGHRYK